jgi:hypothetical protein
VQDGSSLHVESIDSNRVAVRPKQPGAGPDGPIVLRVPPRFCSLDITSGGTSSCHLATTIRQQSLHIESAVPQILQGQYRVYLCHAGGNVHVQAVKEGSLTVESRGGAVHVGSMGGATAELLTAGAHALRDTSSAGCAATIVVA